jgi:hypothetical protein
MRMIRLICAQGFGLTYERHNISWRKRTYRFRSTELCVVDVTAEPGMGKSRTGPRRSAGGIQNEISAEP